MPMAETQLLKVFVELQKRNLKSQIHELQHKLTLFRSSLMYFVLFYMKDFKDVKDIPRFISGANSFHTYRSQKKLKF